MADISNASPRPWKTLSMDDTAIVDRDDAEVAELFCDTDLPEETASANAALIVEAVNSHAALVAKVTALEAMIEQAADTAIAERGPPNDYDYRDHHMIEGIERAMEIFRAALALAKDA